MPKESIVRNLYFMQELICSSCHRKIFKLNNSEDMKDECNFPVYSAFKYIVNRSKEENC